MAITFQLGWLVCVLSGAGGEPLTALPAAALVLACNLWLSRQKPAQELRLLAWVTLVGVIVESVNLAAGVFTLTAPGAHTWLCPAWLALLWTQFATLLRCPLAWLAGRYWLGALLGALFAAPNYIAGARLGAVTLNADTLYSIAMLAALWALAMPTLLWLAQRTGGTPPAARFKAETDHDRAGCTAAGGEA
jgi:hypothetical protein